MFFNKMFFFINRKLATSWKLQLYEFALMLINFIIDMDIY